jgi:hypothetical protein
MGNWSLVYPSRLYWKRFDSNWVIYEEASNQTMALDTAEMDVLMCLSAGSLDGDSLEKQVLEELELHDNNETRVMIGACLSRLESVGLIKQVQDASIPHQSGRAFTPFM